MSHSVLISSRNFIHACVATASLAAFATPVFAQSTKSAGEEYRLLVRPRVGDTLWLQLEQTIETRTISASELKASSSAGQGSGVKPQAPREPDYGPRKQAPPPQVIAMRMFAHSLVEASDLRSTTLFATTDSLHVQTGVPGKLSAPRLMPLSDDGRQVRVRVNPEGAMSVQDPMPGSMALEAGLSGMPAMLPSRPVQVGERWDRDVALPGVSFTGIRADGVVRAHFRLDSLSKNGHLAYVSMEGTLHRDGAVRDLPPGTRMVTAGTMRGTLVLDRMRSWITDARTLIDVQSDVTPAPGDASSPKSLGIRLTQSMKVR